MSATSEGVATAQRRGEEPGTETQSIGHRGGQARQERREALGIQECPDGSRYEGGFIQGLKHGTGRYTWKNGETYVGSFYRDFRHGGGSHCWHTGEKFTGKFYLNRKEGYGLHVYHDGSSFHGLYYIDQRFGPGVITYWDGLQDVGLWDRQYLLRLCTAVGEGFSLRSFPKYAVFLDPAVSPGSLLQVKARTPHRDLLLDDHVILSPSIEKYSTDGDHLPLPGGRRRELDRHFYGKQWKPVPRQYQGYERDPLSLLPLQARMQAHIEKHRLQAVDVGWDVAAVLSLSRDGFGPKGPVEVSSELLLQQASRGEQQAISQLFLTDMVHPDVTDSTGLTALIAATINCHNDVIHLLLDRGADIDKLNSEGMSALAVCHVLYYPVHSLHMNCLNPGAKTELMESLSTCCSDDQISLLDFTASTPTCYSRPQTGNTTLSSNQNPLSDQTTEKETDFLSYCSSKVYNESDHMSNTTPKTPEDSEHLLEETGEREWGDGTGDSKETENEPMSEEESSCGEDEEGSEGEERETEGKCDAIWRQRGGDSMEKSHVVRNVDEEEKRKEQEGKEHRTKHVKETGRHEMLGESGAMEEDKVKPGNRKKSFDSAHAVNSFHITVTEEIMQRSAEALSRTGTSYRTDSCETVRRMAAVKSERRARLDTLMLLLDRGADPNASMIPMPVLFLAILAADTEVVNRLLLCGARTDIPLPPERKGLYPLHVAAALPGPTGPRITELLLLTGTNPDAQACDQDQAPFQRSMKTHKALSTRETPQHTYQEATREPREGGHTALHVACQRFSDYRHASEVVSLLLSYGASTHLLWGGHSPLSLAIANGNERAVDSLLKGGADANLPLGGRVGSALCVLANHRYHCGGKKAEMLNMLVKAGASLSMPVAVDDIVGTAVDFAHYSFNQDSRIAKTPFHALTMQERETLKERKLLLSMMGDLMRQAVASMERSQMYPNGQIDECETETHRKPPPKFCYQCGRSASVKLTLCSRCRLVFYCSTKCKLEAWDQRHKEECVRVSAKAKAAGTQGSASLKSTNVPRPLKVKPKITGNYSFV
ncbi:ankyrin repeat and MYND domain-containing protein 1-like [Genypterus blacodes]|uniref:ankyrin repeat and MYND domain-containing protein 1-like n=1 Tax=Genypterus blacodes TaxID=154954 RepID=UPI003F75EF51